MKSLSSRRIREAISEFFDLGFFSNLIYEKIETGKVAKDVL